MLSYYSTELSEKCPGEHEYWFPGSFDHGAFFPAPEVEECCGHCPICFEPVDPEYGSLEGTSRDGWRNEFVIRDGVILHKSLIAELEWADEEDERHPDTCDVCGYHFTLGADGVLHHVEDAAAGNECYEVKPR